MDWIKQIIECKKENWVSPGSLGQKIKKIRMLRKYTQKELGVMCGFSFSSADVRIAQYEKNKKIPREKILKDMCNALGVGEGALIHADMLSYQEMFYALFDMEDFHGLRPVKKEDTVYQLLGGFGGVDAVQLQDHDVLAGAGGADLYRFAGEVEGFEMGEKFRAVAPGLHPDFALQGMDGNDLAGFQQFHRKLLS